MRKNKPPLIHSHSSYSFTLFWFPFLLFLLLVFTILFSCSPFPLYLELRLLLNSDMNFLFTWYNSLQADKYLMISMPTWKFFSFAVPPFFKSFRHESPTYTLTTFFPLGPTSNNLESNQYVSTSVTLQVPELQLSDNEVPVKANRCKNISPTPYQLFDFSHITHFE